MLKPSLALCLLAVSLPAQTADARAAWANISANLIAAAAKMPADAYAFRPTPGVRTFAELIGHVASAHFMFCAPLLPQAKPAAGVDKLTTKAELLAALKDATNFCTSAADRVTDADPTPVQFFNRDIAKLTLLWSNIAHANEHYGNAVTYLRLKGLVPPSSDSARARVYYDQAHGEMGPPAGLAELGVAIAVQAKPLTPAALRGVRILYLRAPSKAFAAEEKAAVIGFVKGGGSLLLVLDEEQRQSLAGTGVNDLLTPFGLKLTPDTPYVHNCGALAKASEINRADRALPYSGGRAVEGGTPFAYQLDRDGKPAQPFAAYTKVPNGGGRVVVMGEGMASLFLGEKEPSASAAPTATCGTPSTGAAIAPSSWRKCSLG